jgi:hypothetical protein
MSTRRAFALLVFAFVCGLSLASQPVLVITPTGFFYLETGADGVPVSVPVEKIVDLRGGGPGPTPGPTDPRPDNALSVQIRDLAKAIGDPSGAQALALVYTQSGEAVADGLVPVASSLDAVRKASDNALGLTGSATKWDPFRSSLSTIATERTQRGELGTPQQMGDFLKAVAIGLELAADGSQALDFSVIIGVSTGTNSALGIK